MPRGIGKLLAPGNPHVWDYEACRGEGMASALWLKGKAIGGSSSVNGMVYVRGAPADYDAWEAMGCDGWGWRDMGRQFVALEDHQLGSSQWRGGGGGYKSCGFGQWRWLWISATGYLGGGQRFSAAKAFLDPIRQRPNLTVITETDVQRIEFEERRAIAVVARNKTGEFCFDVNREILLCAGAIESPKLLQLSGIGSAEVLRSHAIPVVQDAPDVGRNLREHVYIAAQFRVTRGSFNHCFSGFRLARSVLRYFLFKKGPMIHAAHEAGGFIKTRPGLDRTDAQIGVSLFSMDGDGKTVAIDRKPGITLGGYFMHPQSQGEVHIQSSNPSVPPKIAANYLSAEEDQTAAVALLRWIRELAAQPSLKPFIIEELTPGPHVQNEEDMLAAFRRYGQTAYHVSGTCRMGSDEKAFLDQQLRVRGVSGLRVIDTSLMPALVSGNTNAPAMAIAMRAAEMMTASSKHTSPAHGASTL